MVENLPSPLASLFRAAKTKMWGLDKIQKKSETAHGVVYKTSVLHFKVKNTPLKDTDGKGKFKRMLNFLLVNKVIAWTGKYTP